MLALGTAVLIGLIGSVGNNGKESADQTAAAPTTAGTPGESDGPTNRRTKSERSPTPTKTTQASSPTPTKTTQASSPTPTKPAKMTPRGEPAGAQVATVVSITDGDTLHVQAQRPGRVLRSIGDVTVRLLEIDTPETVDPGEPVACYGPAASDALARLAPPGSKVWVLTDQERFDPYARLLLYMWSIRGGQPRFVNLALVRNGFAKAVLYEPNDRYIGMMRRAEQQARAADRGLWGACPYFGAPLNPPTPTHSPTPTPSASSSGNCDPSYPGLCIPPPPPDLDCDDLPYTGFTVVGNDPHGFDGTDNDGIGCES